MNYNNKIEMILLLYYNFILRPYPLIQIQNKMPDMDVIKAVWKDVWQTGLLFLIWVSIHYAAAHIYVMLCTPLSLIGYFKSIFLVSTPHCRALNWTLSNSASVIDSLWMIVGLYISNNVLSLSRFYFSIFFRGT